MYDVLWTPYLKVLKLVSFRKTKPSKVSFINELNKLLINANFHMQPFRDSFSKSEIINNAKQAIQHLLCQFTVFFITVNNIFAVNIFIFPWKRVFVDFWLYLRAFVNSLDVYEYQLLLFLVFMMSFYILINV